MSELVCPVEIWLHDEHMSMKDVILEVVKNPLENLKALFTYPAHDCDRCSGRASALTSVASAAGRQLVKVLALDQNSTKSLCAGLAGVLATASNGIATGLLSASCVALVAHCFAPVMRVLSKVVRGLKVVRKADQTFAVVRRQVIRFVVFGTAIMGLGAVAISAFMPGYRLHSGADDIGQLWLAALCACFGVTALGKHLSPFLSLINIMDLKGAWNRGIAHFVAMVLNLTKKFVDLFTSRFDVKLNEAIDRWRSRASELPQRDIDKAMRLSTNILTTKGASYGFLGTQLLEDNINEARKNIMDCLEAGPSPSQASSLRLRLNELEKLFEESLFVAGLASNRQPPVCCAILGAPGVGKSYCVDGLAKALANRFSSEQWMRFGGDRSPYFTRNSDTEFFDGYAGQEIIYYSDVFRTTNSKEPLARQSLARELSELQSLIDTAPYFAPFAFEPTPRRYGKGMTISPKCVILTSNYMDVEMFGDPYILGRRVHVTLLLVRREGVEPTAELDHLRCYKKLTPFGHNTPSTGGGPWVAPYSPEHQFPSTDREFQKWPFKKDWEEIELEEVLPTIADKFAQEASVYSRLGIPQCFSAESDVKTMSIGSDPVDQELDLGGNVRCKPLDRGRKLRIYGPGRRELWTWDAKRKKYYRRVGSQFENINIPSRNNDCLFAAIQAAGYHRDLTTDAMRARCRAYYAPLDADGSDPFAPNKMIDVILFEHVAAALELNLSLHTTGDVVVEMSPFVAEYPDVTIHHHGEHFTCRLLKGEYDGWVPRLGGLELADTEMLNDRVTFGPISLFEFGGVQRLSELAVALDANLYSSREGWLVKHNTSGWTYWLINEAVWASVPLDWNEKMRLSPKPLFEWLADSKIEFDQNNLPRRIDDHTAVLVGIDPAVINAFAAHFCCGYGTALSIFGLFVKPVEDGVDEAKTIQPFWPWCASFGSYTSWIALDESMRSAIRLIPLSERAENLGKRSGCLLAAWRWINKLVSEHPYLTALGIFASGATCSGLVTGLVGRMRRQKTPFNVEYVEAVSDEKPARYIFRMADGSNVTAKAWKKFCDMCSDKFKGIVRFCRRDGDVCSAEVTDLSKVSVACPHLWAEPVYDVEDLEKDLAFKAALLRPSNFPRVSLVRDGVEIAHVVGMHLPRGVVAFPAHLVNLCDAGDMIRVNQRDFQLGAIIRNPVDKRHDIALIPNGHNGGDVPLSAFPVHSFSVKSGFERDLCAAWILREGRVLRQLCRLAAVDVSAKATAQNGRSLVVAGYKTLGVDSQPGDCGSLLIHKGKVIGLLSAANGDETIWTPLTSTMVSNWISDYANEVYASSEALKNVLQGYGQQVDTSYGMVLKSFHKFAQSEKFDSPYEPRLTDMGRALELQNKWLPAPISYASYRKTMDRFPQSQVGECDEFLKKACSIYFAAPKTYHPLPSWKSTVNGCADLECTMQILKPVQLDTSPGKPFTEPAHNVPESILPRELCGVTDKKKLYTQEDGKLKLHPAVESLAQRVYEDFLRGIAPRWPFTMALKREIRDIERVRAGKCRLFSMPPHHVNLAIRRLLGHWAGLYKRDGIELGHAIGINVHSEIEWQNLYEFLRKDGFLVMAPDFSAYDVSHPTALNQLIARHVARGYEPKYRRAICAAFLSCNAMEFYDKESRVVAAGQASGSQITTQINCCYTQVLFLAAFLKILGSESRINKDVRIVCYGDDSLIAVSPRLLKEVPDLAERICEYFKEIGYKLTAADKSERLEFSGISKVTFLKRRFCSWDGVMRAPLPEEVLLKSLAYYDGSAENHYEAVKSTLRSFAWELVELPGTDYERGKVLKKVQEALERCPMWKQAFEEIGGISVIDKCESMKRFRRSDLVTDSELYEAMFSPSAHDRYGQSAWCSLNY